MVANMLSLQISRRLQRTPVYHALLEQDHVHLPTLASPRARSGWTAADVMNPAYALVPPDRSIQDVWNGSSSRVGPYLVGSDNRLLGVVQASRLAEELESRPDARVDSLVTAHWIHAHPDHALDVVLERTVESGGLLPIVSRENASELLGVVTLDDIPQRIRARPPSRDALRQDKPSAG
jgi:CBS domain-containing protein